MATTVGKLPPLMLTGDEAVAVVLGLLAAERTGLRTAAPAVASARAKIDRMLPTELRDRVGAVADTLGFSSSGAAPEAPQAEVLLTLGEAVRHHLDRIISARLVGPGCAPPAGFDPVGTVVAGLGAVPWAWQVEVVLRAPTDEVCDRLPRSVGELSEHPAGTLLRGRAERLDGMARLLAGMGWRFRSPAELRAEVRELARRLAEDAQR